MQIDNEIVLYVSEILMGCLMIYMLSSMQFGGEEEEPKKEDLSKSLSTVSQSTNYQSQYDQLIESKFDNLP